MLQFHIKAHQPVTSWQDSEPVFKLIDRISASVLSHYSDLFPQVAAWLLFIVGCLNIIAGLVFRQGAKEKRLIFSWENVSQLCVISPRPSGLYRPRILRGHSLSTRDVFGLQT